MFPAVARSDQQNERTYKCEGRWKIYFGTASLSSCWAGETILSLLKGTSMANQGGSREQHVKAGQQSHKNDRQQEAQSSQRSNQQDSSGKGGGGNFAYDSAKAAEAGRKGGKSS
jgi:hypothetical protein